MDKNKTIKLSWDDFILQGNPDSIDESITEVDNKSFKSKLKVHYEKKGRGGKEALIIRGFEITENHDLESMCKTLKSKLGVGGSVKENEIIIQGNQRDKVIEILKQVGFKDIKKAGG